MRVYQVKQPDGTVMRVVADYIVPRGCLSEEPNTKLDVAGVHPDLIREHDDIDLIKYRFYEHVN